MINKEKQVKHIINALYKIKSINRNNYYDANTLRNIICKDKTGQFVIKELKKNKVNENTLREYGQHKLADIFSPIL